MSAPKYMMGRKVGMTHVFTDEGEQIPVTVITAGPCRVSQVKSAEGDGYFAVQIAYEPVREKVLSKPENGHFKKAGLDSHRFLREVRLDEPTDLEVGAEFKVDVFEPGDRVDVVGTVKGRGFQGTIRAHNFKGKRRTHGNMNQRGPGAIGMHSQPGEVLKGQRMATHWGDERATVRNLEVIEVDAENNSIVLRGAVPGARQGFVQIRAARACRARKES
ncbi:MAG: 50S ribosomal protein L3 [Planctomycetota bacterium JB042]